MNWPKRKAHYLFPAALLAAWQLAASAGLLPMTKIPSPYDILQAIRELAASGLPQGNTLLFHCLYSLLRVSAGFLLALTLALPLGIVCGR